MTARSVPTPSPAAMVRRLRAAVVAVLALILLSIGAPAVGAADEPSATSSVPPSTAVDPGLGDLDGGATTPSPRGQPAPPTTQRVADSVIAGALLVVLAGGVALAIWTGRRTSARQAAPEADEPAGGPQRER